MFKKPRRPGFQLLSLRYNIWTLVRCMLGSCSPRGPGRSQTLHSYCTNDLFLSRLFMSIEFKRRASARPRDSGGGVTTELPGGPRTHRTAAYGVVMLLSIQL